jgi:hypothetical protein
MIPINITEVEKLGVVFIRLAENVGKNIYRYFEGINKLQDIHCSGILLSSIKGYYLSLWRDRGIRFSYFTNDANDSENFLYEEFSKIGLGQYLPSVKPRDETYSYYHGKNKSNLDFRRFLLLITNIGMDLLQYDINYGRRLAAKYRLEIAPSGVSSKTYFETAFNKLSYYNSLTIELRNELLNDLDYWHTSWEDWAHMFVVMLLPGDWIYNYKSVFNPRRPIDEKSYNGLVQSLEYY